MARKKAASEATAAEPKKRASRKKATESETPEGHIADVGAETEEDDDADTPEVAIEEIEEDTFETAALNEESPQEPEQPIRKARGASKAKKKEPKQQRTTIADLIDPVRLNLVDAHEALPTTDAITSAFAGHYQEALERLAFALRPVADATFAPPPPPLQDLAAMASELEEAPATLSEDAFTFDAEVPASFEAFDAPSEDDAPFGGGDVDPFAAIDELAGDHAAQDSVFGATDDDELIIREEDAETFEEVAAVTPEPEPEPAVESEPEVEEEPVLAAESAAESAVEVAVAEADESDEADAEEPDNAPTEGQAASETPARKSRKSKRKR